MVRNQRQAGPHKDGLKPMSASSASDIDGMTVLKNLLPFPIKLSANPKVDKAEKDPGNHGTVTVLAVASC